MIFMHLISYNIEMIRDNKTWSILRFRSCNDKINVMLHTSGYWSFISPFENRYELINGLFNQLRNNNCLSLNFRPLETEKWVSNFL